MYKGLKLDLRAALECSLEYMQERHTGRFQETWWCLRTHEAVMSFPMKFEHENNLVHTNFSMATKNDTHVKSMSTCIHNSNQPHLLIKSTINLVISMYCNWGYPSQEYGQVSWRTIPCTVVHTSDVLPSSTAVFQGTWGRTTVLENMQPTQTLSIHG
jgi:hypothetical protein